MRLFDSDDDPLVRRGSDFGPEPDTVSLLMPRREGVRGAGGDARQGRGGELPQLHQIRSSYDAHEHFHHSVRPVVQEEE